MTVLVTTVDGVFSLFGDVPELVLAHLCSVYGDSSIEIVDASGQSPADSLRAMRKRSGLSQSELARQLGTTKQMVSNLERGERAISRKMAYRLALVFGTVPGRFV